VVLFWHERNPVKYGVRVQKMGTIKNLKDQLAALVGLLPEQLVMAEIYTFRPFKIPDSKLLYDIRSSDLVFAYQVMPPGPELLVKSEHHDMQIDEAGQGDLSQREATKAAYKYVNQVCHVPVFHKTGPDLFGRPVILSCDRTSTTNRQIHQMILERVARYVGLDLSHLDLSLVDSFGNGPSCPLPCNDELFVFDDANMGIAINWDRDVLSHLHLRNPKFEEHESLQRAKRDAELCVELEDCLSLFTATELLDGGSLWRCPDCQAHRLALKRMEVWTCPPVLIIHLKRFQYTHVFRDKICTKVNFPVVGLDLSSHVSEGNTAIPPIYDLYAVSNHTGTLGSGHYTAYVRNPITKTWFKLDDNTATKVDNVENIITDSAYMLFYINRAFSEQESLDDIEQWIGVLEEGKSEVIVSSPSVQMPSSQSDDIGKYKEAKITIPPLSDKPRGRSKSDGVDTSDVEMQVYRAWNEGSIVTSEKGHDTGRGPVTINYMGGHRGDPMAVSPQNSYSNLNHTDVDSPGQSSRKQLVSPLYICPKCEERLPSLDDLQVHVLCTHPEALDLLQALTG